MGSLFFECTVRAALLVASTAIVLSVMRVKPAAARHRVWSAVVLLMLLLPIWTAWGPKASLRVLPPSAQGTAKEPVTPVVSLSIAFLSPSLTPTLQAVVLGVYLLGLCFLLSKLAVGTVRANRIIRDSALNDGMRSSHLCAAPVAVGFFHPTVILPNHWREFPEAQLDVILTHECEHARRRDSLIQWLALLNRAVFWFHPVAWWLERHLSALAEEACDNVVLARGHNPHEYSECLIEMARSVMHAGARVNVAGMSMPGIFLRQRIRKIIEDAPIPRTSRAQITCVAVIFTIMSSVMVAGTLGRIRQVTAEQSTKTERHPDGLQILTPHEGVDFTAFSTDLSKTVKRNWWAKMPVEAKGKEGAEGSAAKGKVVIRIRIQKDGGLGGVLVEASSGKKPLDDAAVSAIRASAPFEHLPESFKGSNIELRLTFFYNMPISD
jgi:TonB family protein